MFLVIRLLITMREAKMEKNNYNIPLHKRTHWRRIKNIFKAVARIEGFKIEKYNLEKIRCYEITR